MQKARVPTPTGIVSVETTTFSRLIPSVLQKAKCPQGLSARIFFCLIFTGPCGFNGFYQILLIMHLLESKAVGSSYPGYSFLHFSKYSYLSSLPHKFSLLYSLILGLQNRQQRTRKKKNQDLRIDRTGSGSQFYLAQALLPEHPSNIGKIELDNV